MTHSLTDMNVWVWWTNINQILLINNTCWNCNYYSLLKIKATYIAYSILVTDVEHTVNFVLFLLRNTYYSFICMSFVYFYSYTLGTYTSTHIR